jgi:hypothetical protein
MSSISAKQQTSRRDFLGWLGGATVLVVGGGVWRAWDQGIFSVGQGPAYEPWKDWRSTTADGPLGLVKAAILAANAHNMQSWKFQVTNSQIDLFADLTRNDGAADPFYRELYIGLGCALENLLIAANAVGYHYEFKLFPETDPTHIARVSLTPSNPLVSELYEAIPNRHTNRAAYDTQRPIEPRILTALNSLNINELDVKVFWFSTPEERTKVGDLTLQATEAFIADAEQSHDSNAWFRHDWDELQSKRDGMTLDSGGTSSFGVALAKLLPAMSAKQNDGYWLKATKTQVQTAGAFGILAATGYESSDWVKVGRLWQRMHLWATKEGLAMQPINQMSERAGREVQLGIESTFGKALEELLSNPSWKAVMPFRIGYPTTKANPSPRRAVQDVVIG